MRAIIELGGKQYTVSKEQILYVELQNDKEIGSEFQVEKVLLVQDEANTKVGEPYLAAARVSAKVLEEVKAPKVHGFMYKRRKNMHRKWGHRQRYHKIQVTSISA